MGTIKSAPITIRVTKPADPGTSVLSQLAASMAPGTWAKLTPGNNQNTFLGVGGISGTMIHYCNSMPWNPKNKSIEIQAMDHGYGRQRYVRYDSATNSFILVKDDDGTGTSTQHGYDHVTVNPYTGEVYQRACRIGTNSLFAYKWALNGNTPTTIPSVTTNYDQIAIGCCWWSGSFAGGGAQGTLLFFNSGPSFGANTDGQIVGYNPLTNSWFLNKSGVSPFYKTSGNTYHSVIEYSTMKNVAIYGGGNDNPKKIWRLNADASFTALPDVPGSATVGMQQGVICEDPKSGNFILLSHGQLWELNPSNNGTWTQLTGTRVPPSGVGDPAKPDGVICTPISDYGVIAYITQTSQTGGTFYLYKHG